jgi:tetratricopeptide (TPR) repeat protein
MDLYDKALDIFLQGIKQFPKFSELYYLAAAALLKLHQRQSALELLEQALQMDITKCELLFETIPALSLDLEILDLINSYKSKDSWV